MDAWGVATRAEEISALLSVSAAHELLAAVEGLAEGAALRRSVRRNAPEEVQAAFSSLLSDVGVDRACAAVAASVFTRSRIEAETEQIEIVWTGPETLSVSNHRTTAAVVHELIGSAKSHITMATYSASNVDDVIGSLDKRRRAGVEIRLLLETLQSTGKGSDCPKIFEQLVPYVTALEWPRSSRKSHDWNSMHVKVLIRDADAVLVTSANTSGAAMRDNMELGVLLKGGSVPQRLRDHFDKLEEEGVLQPL